MEITSRQGTILEKIVGEYIGSAKPISSQFLEKKLGLGVCPATIRIEMQKLTDRGYLFQPHTSAGRIPTDKGYRFFVNSLLEKEPSGFDDIFEIEKMMRAERKNVFKWFSQLTKSLAEAASALTIGYLSERKFFSREGWEGILKEPEFEDRDFLLSFADFLKSFEKEIESLELNCQTKIFIGSESPFKKARNFSVILRKYEFPKREKGIVSILGPKRMVYERNIGLINSLTRLLEGA